MPLPQGTFEILKAYPFVQGKKILDIGLGDGQATTYFLEQGLAVEATGFALNSGTYHIDDTLLDSIEVKENTVTSLDYPDETFDYVFASHIFEHEINPGLGYDEVRRVLRPGGILIICVPPYRSWLVGGHVNTGYSLSQLMYHLLLHKFDIKTGSFLKYGYNLCAIVKKDPSIQLPNNLTYANGDIEKLSSYFPISVKQYTMIKTKKVNWKYPLPNEIITKFRYYIQQNLGKKK